LFSFTRKKNRVALNEGGDFNKWQLEEKLKVEVGMEIQQATLVLAEWVEELKEENSL
jgi:hypothetical protein